MADLTPAEELRELIREAHGLMKDLRAERRAITKLLDGIPAKVDDRIKAHLTPGLEEFGRVTQKAMAASVEKVTGEFDRLKAIFLGTHRAQVRAGKPSVEDLVRRVRAGQEADRG